MKNRVLEIRKKEDERFISEMKNMEKKEMTLVEYARMIEGDEGIQKIIDILNERSDWLEELKDLEWVECTD